jgi:hypothetical protein
LLKKQRSLGGSYTGRAVLEKTQQATPYGLFPVDTKLAKSPPRPTQLQPIRTSKRVLIDNDTGGKKTRLMFQAYMRSIIDLRQPEVKHLNLKEG